MIYLVWGAIFCFASALTGVAAAAGVGDRAPGIAMHGAPARTGPAAERPFAYVNPDAPKGGRLVLGQVGTFDSLNANTYKGSAASGLRDWVHESLLVRAGDEPFSLYGLIAEAIEVAADRSAITFHLRREARFADGQPITSADVVFTHGLLKAKGWPFQRGHYGKVARVDAPDPHRVTFTFDAGGDREIPLIIGLMPILPKHRVDPDTFERTTLEKPIGSGPYVVADVDPGRAITYRRNPDWWARDLAVTRGRFNFDEIRVEYFRDSGALFEAFKTGQIDVRTEDEPTRWATGYAFPAIEQGKVRREEITTRLPAGMTGLVFNTRRKPFDDVRVRRALASLFDAPAINKDLFAGLLERTRSYFARSVLAASGTPADAIERGLLAPHLATLKPGLIDGDTGIVADAEPASLRTRQQQAITLLGQAGYRLTGGRMTGPSGPLSFEFLAQTRAQERVMLAWQRMLAPVGISLSIRPVDSAQYWARAKAFEYDMLQWTWPASLSPGNELYNRFGAKAAAIQGTLNYAGVADPAVDAMIDAIVAAPDRPQFEAAVRAFDRLLLSGDYVIPLFHQPKVWVATWTHLKRPALAPLGGLDLDTWWSERK